MIEKQRSGETRKAWRDRMRGVREIEVTVEARCDKCRSWGRPGTCNTFTLSDPALCKGLCCGPTRENVTITKNGICPNMYAPTPEEAARYADDISGAITRARSEGRARRWVSA